MFSVNSSDFWHLISKHDRYRDQKWPKKVIFSLVPPISGPIYAILCHFFYIKSLLSWEIYFLVYTMIIPHLKPPKYLSKLKSGNYSD